MQQEAIEVGKADETKPAMMVIRTDTNQPTAQEAMDKYTIEKASPIGILMRDWRLTLMSGDRTSH